VSATSPILVPDKAPSPTPPLRRLGLDPLLVLAVAGLGICSLLTLSQATSTLIPGDPGYYVKRQAVYLVVGFVLMLVVSRVDYKQLRRARNGIYLLLIGSILAVKVLGAETLGAQRAIQLGFFSFQGSEIGKVLLILALAAFIVDNARTLDRRETTAKILLVALVPSMLVIAQPDLGSGLVYLFITAVLLIVAGTPARRLAALAALVLACGAVVFVAAPAAGVHLLKPYQEKRLTAFLNPTYGERAGGQKVSKATEEQEEASYQLLQSEIAIGAGGKTGQSNPTQTRLNFLPEQGTDFVFAAVGENWGFVGASIVVGLYMLLLWRTMRIVLGAKDLFGTLIAAGVAAMLMFQAFVSMGMSTGIMPVTGVPLPLISYGGSSVISVMVAVGLLQSIYLRARAAASVPGRVLR
jgi:rod shape determining protein RodA